jgi:hypothetical protein
MRGVERYLPSSMMLLVLCVLALLGWRRSTARSNRALRQSVQQRDSLRAEVLSIQQRLRVRSRLAAYSRLDSNVTLDGVLQSGMARRVSLSASPGVVLYTINPLCAACAVNKPFVDSVMTTPDCKAERLAVYVAADGVRKDAELSNVPILLDASGSAWRALSLDVTPLMLVVGADRRVIGAWTGEFSEKDRPEIRRAVGDVCGKALMSSRGRE